VGDWVLGFGITGFWSLALLATGQQPEARGQRPKR